MSKSFSVPHYYWLDYLTQFEGDRTNSSWNAIKIIKVAKGDAPNGFCVFKIDGKNKRYDKRNWEELPSNILPLMGRRLQDIATADSYLVPIPNSDMTPLSGIDHRIIHLANLLVSGHKAAGNAPQVDVLPTLCWSSPKTSQRATPGRRSPDKYRGKFRLRSGIDRPVILFDDVYTSGSQAKAALQYLKGKGVDVTAVVTLGKTVHEPSERPISFRQGECVVDADPFDLEW